MSDSQHYLARVRSLALAAMATADGKPLRVAASSAPPPPPAPLPRRSSPRPAGVAANRLPAGERLRPLHQVPAGDLLGHYLSCTAAVAGVGLSTAERRQLAHLSPAAIAAIGRVVAKLSDGT